MHALFYIQDRKKAKVEQSGVLLLPRESELSGEITVSVINQAAVH